MGRKADSDGALRLVLVSREYPPFYGGGIGTYARWIVPALVDAGVRVTVVTQAHGVGTARVELDGPVTVYRIPMFVGAGGWTVAAMRFSVACGRLIASLARRGKVDLAEFAECEGAGSAMLALRRAGVRVPGLVHFHTPSEMLYELRSLSTRALDANLGAYFLMERVGIRLADGLCAPSRFIADWAHQHYGLDERPEVIPYAIGPVADAPAMGDGRDVLFIGRIEPRKGVESLIRAWNRVSARYPDAVLRLAGGDTAGAPDGGSMRAYLKGLLEPDAARSVQFLGRLRPESLEEEYARASVCVIPSLWENFPNTCIESMLHARAVVVSDNGGMAEMVGGTEAGLVFEAGEAEALVGALCGVLGESGSRRAERGAIGRARIMEMCDPGRVAAARVRLFERTIEAARSGRRGGRAVLGEWKRAQDLLRGGTDSMGMPALGGAIAQWIEPAAERDMAGVVG